MPTVETTRVPVGASRGWPMFSRAPSLWDDEKPIREELFGVDRDCSDIQLTRAVSPSRKRSRTSSTRGLPLAGRLADNGVVLLSAYRSIVAATDDGRAITPAAEWLIDNYHLVEKQLRQISADLPPGYYRQLPKLVSGPFAGYPRAFGMAWAYVAHTDSCFDVEVLVAYVNAYQEIQPLTIGELWAASITLQIVLIENLRRLARQIMVSRAGRREADGLADRLLGVGGRPPEAASTVFAGRPDGPLPDAFAVQLVHRLRDQDPKFTPALAWLDERLAKQNMTADAAVREVHRSQGAANVTVRNIVTSLRVIAEVDWKELFERFCLVDAELAKAGRFHGDGFRDPHALSQRGRGIGARVPSRRTRRRASGGRGRGRAASRACRRPSDPGARTPAIICWRVGGANSKPRSDFASSESGPRG